MAAITPRRSERISHIHTPRKSERKKGLFQEETSSQPESLTKHRRLSVVDSESDESDDYDLGIISTLDSSSGEETGQNSPKTPERSLWRETQSRTKKFKEKNDLKNFIKSPFTLKKYQTRYSCPETKCGGSSSTPVTPHLRNHPGTPSSSHSCASVNTTSSTSSRARKSLASLIADTESCSSSLKDLNFDSDSASDSKENTPTKNLRRSGRRLKLTPKLNSFKGILVDQKKNISPLKTAVVCLTKMDMTNFISPTQMLKTPHNTSETKSPPKRGHNRRSAVVVEESPESTHEGDKSHKRLHYDSMIDNGPSNKYPRLDTATAPKARTSLFNSDRLKEILSAKSFYGKTNPELNSTVTSKISNAIEVSNTHHRRPFTHSQSNRHKKKPGQINLGVRHKIRKPKFHKNKNVRMKGTTPYNNKDIPNNVNKSAASNGTVNDSLIQSCEELENDKADPYDQENQTIKAILSQWTEDDPEDELSFSKPKADVPCFNRTIIEETSSILQPITAIPVTSVIAPPQDSNTVIVELGVGKEHDNTNSETVDAHNIMMFESVQLPNPVLETTEFLPAEGYSSIGNNAVLGEEELLDLDEIDHEMKILDEKILQMAHLNNINAEVILASTETFIPAINDATVSQPTEVTKEKPINLFPIFHKPNPGISSPKKGAEKRSKKMILKTGDDQYVIDAGQKNFGATQCKECGVIYQIGDPQDENDHLIYHNASDVLRFTGLKEEYVVERTETSRCIRVRGGDHGWKRVEAVLTRVVHAQLGYEASLPHEVHLYTAYLYIEKKQIAGCLIVEPKLRAYKLIPGDTDCCTIEDYPVKCGVSRIWTHTNYRRRGVASMLLDCARVSFLHGSALTISDIAFSAPTPAGKAFATKYTGTDNFFLLATDIWTWPVLRRSILPSLPVSSSIQFLLATQIFASSSRIEPHTNFAKTKLTELGE